MGSGSEAMLKSENPSCSLAMVGEISEQEMVMLKASLGDYLRDNFFSHQSSPPDANPAIYTTSPRKISDPMTASVAVAYVALEGQRVQIKTTGRLEKSSRRLELLTYSLIVLTLGLAWISVFQGIELAGRVGTLLIALFITIVSMYLLLQLQKTKATIQGETALTNSRQ